MPSTPLARLLRTLSDLLDRRARSRRTRTAEAARHEASLRAEARQVGCAVIERLWAEGATADVTATARREASRWAAQRTSPATPGGGRRGLPPAPDDYHLGHPTAGLLTGVAVFCAAGVVTSWAAEHGHPGTALVVFLMGVLGAPGIWLAMALPKLADPRVRYWTEQLCTEAVRAAEARVGGRRLEGPGPG